MRPDELLLKRQFPLSGVDRVMFAKNTIAVQFPDGVKVAQSSIQVSIDGAKVRPISLPLMSALQVIE